MRLLALCICLFISFQTAYSQTYQRIFRHGDRNTTVMGATLHSNNNVIVLSTIGDTDGVHGINVTSHNVKGDNIRSRDYIVQDSISIEPFGEIIKVEEDNSLVFTVRTRQNGAYGNILCKSNLVGDLEYATALGGTFQDTSYGARTELAVSPFGGFLVAAQDSIDSLSSIVLHQMTIDGMQAWTKSYSFTDTVGTNYTHSFSDMAVAHDSTTMIVGSYRDSLDNGLYLLRLDTLGVPIWSRKYQFGSSNEIAPLDMTVLRDSSVVIVGARRLDDIDSGFAIKIDNNGNVVWSNNLMFATIPNNNEPMIANEVVEGQNGQIIVSGLLNVLAGDNSSFGAFMSELDVLTGMQVWSKKYDDRIIENIDTAYVSDDITQLRYDPLRHNDRGNLMATNDEHYIFVNTSVDAQSTDNINRVPIVVKADTEGAAMCEEEYSYVISPLTVNVDTLVWSEGAGGFLQSIDVTRFFYAGISAPTLSIEEVEVCPNLPVDTILDATIMNAISYEWETGDTTAIINVTEEGDYPVTVTLDTEVCFELCDTAKVSLLDELTSEIVNINWDRWCEERLVQMDADADGGMEDYTFMWSTGDSTSIIFIPEDSLFQTFMVTVMDECGMISITEQYLDTDHPGRPLPEEASIDFLEDIYCDSPEDNRIYRLELGVTGGFDQSTVQWNTGAADDGLLSIEVEGPGTYSVTLIDDCMYEISAEIDFDVPEPEEISLVVIEDECFEQIEIDFEMGDIDISTIQWSTGAGDNGQTSIVVDEYGVPYSVTVEDDCNYILTDEITPDPSLEPTPDEISFEIIDDYCENGATLVVITGPEGYDSSTITWNPGGAFNGMETLEVFNTEPVVYTLSLIDKCGLLTDTTFEAQSNPPITPTIDLLVDTINYCENGFVSFFSDFTGDVNNDSYQFYWLELDADSMPIKVFGDSDPFELMSLDTSRRYFAEIKDLCNQTTYIDSIDFSPALFPPCGTCFMWPNIFFPDRTIDGEGDDDDVFFRPVPVGCNLNFIDQYELYVYNGYGNLVFESFDPDLGWSGSTNGDKQPTGVYMWYSRWTYNGTTYEERGDVSLMR